MRVTAVEIDALVDQLGRDRSLAALGIGVEEGGAFAQRHLRAIGAQLALQNLALRWWRGVCPVAADAEDASAVARLAAGGGKHKAGKRQRQRQKAT